LVKSAKILAKSERLLKALEVLSKDVVAKKNIAPACRKLEQLLRMLAVNDVLSAEDLLKETHAALLAQKCPRKTLH
jgi:hypothetical protein